MREELSVVGRREPKAALQWWYGIEHSNVTDLRRRKLYMAPMFIEVARAFLSIQASSAAAERLFGDAGYNEGIRRQHTADSMTEMLLMIRSYILSYIECSGTQKSFLSSRAQMTVDLADKISKQISKQRQSTVH